MTLERICTFLAPLAVLVLEYDTDMLKIGTKGPHFWHFFI